MKYCPRCGVVLAEDAEACPLCGSASVDQKPPAADAGGVEYPRPSRDVPEPFADVDPGSVDIVENLNAAERSRIAVELLSVGFGIALVVTILADLFAERGFGWSRYSSVGIVAAWTAAAVPFILRKHPWLIFAAIAPSFVLFVFLLDAVDGQIRWFLGLGLPIVLLSEGVVAGVGSLFGVMKRKGLNVVAVVVAGVAAFCVGLEFILDLYLARRPALEWSVIVSFALVPTSGLLFYLHYRVMHRASLRKLFRL